MELTGKAACLEGLPLVMYVGKAAEIFFTLNHCLDGEGSKTKRVVTTCAAPPGEHWCPTLIGIDIASRLTAHIAPYRSIDTV
jgi:hypothetical protein